MVVKKALRRSLAQVRHVTPVPPGAARGLVADVYAQVERDFGMLAPPVALHSAAPEVMAGVWMLLRESLLAQGLVSRAAKELVATEVSRANACPYCVDVHGATLRGLGGPAPAMPEPGPEVIGTRLTFHYLNRMVNVFLGESPLPPAVPGAVRGGALRVLGSMMGSSARRSRPPGDSLGLLPDAPLPADLHWAEGNPYVAGAVARATAAVSQAGERSVPEPVRELVTAEVAKWDGTPPGPSRAWCEDAVAALAPAHRPTGRLALLTAMASYQAGTAVGDVQADDRGLLEITAWASMVAARARSGGS
ncbi:carboxymuconolactone decarboxylase family protein [Acrocarpospora macrocephala]|uniref:Alkyl hydroperoxide reductase AhpD n=1 Tax=Acrocarpospora macrocephala TaxID=150177 RepID=A0A5M3WEP8_9ACTN|nr:carboxymuconolactone decarboxylase family protein [Acrocarpospora macrocephala]GES06572.1 alkyl hydroperoxide reductase AhpD [Acrocarpospora macrocephala]